MEKFGLHKHLTIIKASRFASQQIGTTAKLTEGHTFSLWDLLHGLMLPSGNDAAVALAEYFGNYLLKNQGDSPQSPYTNAKLLESCVLNITSNSKEFSEVRKDTSPNFYNTSSSSYSCDIDKSKSGSTTILPLIKCKKSTESVCDYSFSELSSSYCDSGTKREKHMSMSQDRQACSRSFTSSFPFTNKSEFSSSPEISRFIMEMNVNARKLKMRNTYFDSPHGLPNKNNYSTAYDIALLCSV